MKTLYLLLTAFLFVSPSLVAQNIDDNKVNFQYIQLPLQKINPLFTQYEVRVQHDYRRANEDSTQVFAQRKQLQEVAYQSQYAAWVNQKKQLDRQYLTQMAAFEKAQLAGTPATQPVQPQYPAAPVFVPLDPIRMNSEASEQEITQGIDLKGYTKGLGGFIINYSILPIQGIRIVESKKGSGANTRYEYVCQYMLPIDVTIETPTEGQIFKRRFLETTQAQSMKTYNSTYEFQLWWMDNQQQFYADLERDARKRVLNEVNQQLNNEFGFVPTTRGAELYTVKKYRDYGYADITKAYTLSTQALNLVAKDRNRSTAFSKLNEAINAWKELLQESNLSDDKARVNDKITAVIHCNLAELYIWTGNFDAAELHINLAQNSGVMKARNHAKGMESFFQDQKRRWQANF